MTVPNGNSLNLSWFLTLYLYVNALSFGRSRCGLLSLQKILWDLVESGYADLGDDPNLNTHQKIGLRDAQKKDSKCLKDGHLGSTKMIFKPQCLHRHFEHLSLKLPPFLIKFKL